MKPALRDGPVRPCECCGLCATASWDEWQAKRLVAPTEEEADEGEEVRIEEELETEAELAQMTHQKRIDSVETQLRQSLAEVAEAREEAERGVDLAREGVEHNAHNDTVSVRERRLRLRVVQLATRALAGRGARRGAERGSRVPVCVAPQRVAQRVAERRCFDFCELLREARANG